MLGEFLNREVSVFDTIHRYAVYVPPNMPKNPPVILFLHGRGESGVDGEVQTQCGLGVAIRNNPERWPFLVVFPQKPVFDLLWPVYSDIVDAVLKSVQKEFKPHKTKRYLTGLSQGGNGTLELVDGLAWKFAAMAPICGWCNPRNVARKMHETPIWIFHGEADQAVPASSSQAVADWFKVYGGEPKLKLYPEVGHNSWDLAYAEALPEWFLSHEGKE